MDTDIEQLNSKNYIEQRVDDQLAYYENAANRAKRKYTWMQTWIIILGLLVPVVINIPTSWGNGIDIGVQVKIAVTIMSLVLAILNGLLNFRKYGDLWLSYRMTEEVLKNEKFLFLTATGKYSDRESAFPNFVQTIETIISSEHNKFRGLIEQVKQSSGASNGQQAPEDLSS